MRGLRSTPALLLRPSALLASFHIGLSLRPPSLAFAPPATRALHSLHPSPFLTPSTTTHLSPRRAPNRPAVQGVRRAMAAAGGDSIVTKLPGMKQVLFIEAGWGADQHGQDATKAAMRACRNAIEFNSIPSIRRLVPGGYENMALRVTIAAPKEYHGNLDLEKVKGVFPYGKKTVVLQDGGGVFTSGIALKAMGDVNDDMLVVLAHVAVGIADPDDAPDAHTSDPPPPLVRDVIDDDFQVIEMEGMTQALFIEAGIGADQHGQDANKAVLRACRNAIELNSIPCIKALVPGGYKNMLLDVTVAVPSGYTGDVDLAQVKECFPFGEVRARVQEGGAVFTSGTQNSTLGDSSDQMLIAVAHVVVGARELLPLGE